MWREDPSQTTPWASIHRCTKMDIRGIVGLFASLLLLLVQDGSCEVPSGSPWIALSPIIHRVQRTQSVKIWCTAHGNPKPEITWIKDDEPVDLSNPRFKLLPSGFLQISNAQYSDAGRYECVATNVRGVAHSESGRLEVRVRLYGPQFTEVPAEVIVVTPGESLTLTCAAEGTIDPYVSWYQGKTRLSKPPIPRGRNTLVLTNIVRSANYTCQAVSLTGKVRHLVKLELNGTETPIETPPTNFQGGILTSITLWWKRPAYTGDPIVGYEVSYFMVPWYKYLPDPAPSLIRVDAQTTSVTISQLVNKREYVFRVRAVKTTGYGPLSDPIRTKV